LSGSTGTVTGRVRRCAKQPTPSLILRARPSTSPTCKMPLRSTRPAAPMTLLFQTLVRRPRRPPALIPPWAKARPAPPVAAQGPQGRGPAHQGGQGGGEPQRVPPRIVDRKLGQSGLHRGDRADRQADRRRPGRSSSL